MPGAASVRGTRTTVGAMLPKAIFGAGPRIPPMATLAIAWAARVPTFRKNCFPSRGGISTATINSSGDRTDVR